MKTIIQYLSLFFLTVFLFSCGGGATGGSEFGNPDRPIIGTVVEEGGSALIKAASASCPADTVIAADSLGNITVKEVSSDCSFRIILKVGSAYILSFTLDNVFVAVLAVNNSPLTLESTAFFITSGDTDVDLGIITILGTTAFPENQPAEQNDQDGDGVNDFADDDDNDDGESDEEEEDCDLDGFIDDHDEDDDNCEGIEEAGRGEVLEVEPDNNETFVNLNDEVEARFDCDVDASTISSSTFTVASAIDTIACNFEISDDEIDCKHESEDFFPDTTYTATINGLKCEDGTDIEVVSWSWTTRS